MNHEFVIKNSSNGHQSLTCSIHYGVLHNLHEGRVMNRPILNQFSITYQNLLAFALAMTIFCLFVSWAIESLIVEIYRLG